MNIQLAMIPVDEHAQIVEMVLPRIHHCFPYRALLQFSVTHHAIGIEAWVGTPCDREALCYTDALAHRAGRYLYSGENGAGVTIENAFVASRVFQDALIE